MECKTLADKMPGARELCQAVPGTRGAASPRSNTRKQAALDAGLSDDQRKTALRDAQLLARSCVSNR